MLREHSSSTISPIGDLHWNRGTPKVLRYDLLPVIMIQVKLYDNISITVDQTGKICYRPFPRGMRGGRRMRPQITPYRRVTSRTPSASRVEESVRSYRRHLTLWVMVHKWRTQTDREAHCCTALSETATLCH